MAGADGFLQDILERSSFPGERLGPRFEPAPGADPGVVQARLERWSARLGPGGDPGRRLAWAGLDPALALRAVAPARWRGGRRPGWVRTLEAVLAAAEDLDRRPGRRKVLAQAAFRGRAAIPFQTFYLPFLEVFRQRLGRGGGRGMAGPELWTDLFQAALGRLYPIGAATLRHESGMALAFSGLVPPSGDPECFSGSRLRGLFRDYPVLARFLAEALDQAARALGECLARYRADRKALEGLFGQPLGRIMGLRDGLSDPHGGGRTVLRLTTASGRALYYKPRSLAMDLAFQAFLGEFEGRDGLLPMFRARILDRGSHGWAGEVPRRPLPDLEAAGRYHHRLGQLLAFCHVLKARDLHFQNLVAHGECPVPVDLETLLHPRERPGAPGAGPRSFLREVERRFYGDTLLAAMILPMWREAGRDRIPQDPSALGRGAQGATPPWDAPPAPPDPWIHRAEILAGFTAAYRALLAERSRLLARDGPLAPFRRLEARHIQRETHHYATLLRGLRGPGQLRDGFDAALYLELLVRPHVRAGGPTPDWPVLEPELKALLEGDVPRFTCRCQRRDLRPGGAPGRGFFRESPLARVRRGVEELGEPDLLRQRNLILHALFSRNQRFEPAPQAPEPAPGVPPGALEPALQVARALRATTWTVPGHGGAGWAGFGEPLAAGYHPYQPLDVHLHDGLAGVALFLAALEAVTGGAGFRDLALAALAPVREVLRGSRDPVGDLGIGAGRGIGSLVYALTRCAAWLDEPDLLADAALGAAALTPATLDGRIRLAVHDGLAGACLALLVLHPARPEGRWLEAATLLGDQILGRLAGFTGSGLCGLAFPGGSGFAQGAAGVAHALARLARATGLRRFRDGAEAAMVLGRTRPPDGCLDIAGIGLARAGTLDVLDTPAIREELEAALAAVQDPPRLPFANLGQGAMALAEVAFTLGRDLGRADGIRLGRDRAWALFQAWGGRGALRWYPGEDLFSPGLFVGSAGLGYQALRLARPERVPCLLRFE